jgi:broad specificity phosphatase PhoE
MKKIYFVRHGESEGNVASAIQSGEVPLTANGKKQAEFIADRFTELPIEVIVSSTMLRAQETANIISAKINAEVISSELLIERQHPSLQVGKKKTDSQVVESEKLIFENFGKEDYKFSDEENFADLKDRASKILDFLAQRPEKDILVVSHGFIMRIILAVIVIGKDLTAQQCKQFISAFHMENTGVTIFDYDVTKDNPWRVWVWNDHAHLKELSR